MASVATWDDDCFFRTPKEESGRESDADGCRGGNDEKRMLTPVRCRLYMPKSDIREIIRLPPLLMGRGKGMRHMHYGSRQGHGCSRPAGLSVRRSEEG